MLQRFTTLKGDLHIPDLVREAAERSLRVAVSAPASNHTEPPFGTGSVCIQEVQPGLRCETLALTCHADRAIEVVSEPLITCSLLLEGAMGDVEVDQYGVIANPQNKAVLKGFGQPSRWVRHLRKGDHFKAFAFTMQPEFFERFASVVEDQQLAVFEPFQRGQSSVVLPQSQRLINLARTAFDRPYSGALDALFHESNTLQFVLEVAKLLSQENAIVQDIGRSHYERLMAARAILDKDLIAPPKTLDLARLVGTNVNTLQAHFKRVFHTTIFGYIRTRRLEVARVLITEHCLSSKETAYRVGFSNPAAFTAAYRKHYGHPPTAEVVVV